VRRVHRTVVVHRSVVDRTAAHGQGGFGGSPPWVQRAVRWLSQADDEETWWWKKELVDVMFGQRRGETKGGSNRGEAQGRSWHLI
jgi:hypothetical protein